MFSRLRDSAIFAILIRLCNLDDDQRSGKQFDGGWNCANGEDYENIEWNHDPDIAELHYYDQTKFFCKPKFIYIFDI